LARALAAVFELAVSPRGLALAYLLVAAALAVTGWLRPPLSADIPGTRLPLGCWAGGEVAPEDLLSGRGPAGPGRLGVILLAVVLLGAGAVLVRPQSLGVTAGLLLGAALAANAAAACNHPALIELLDDEFEQRQQIATAVTRPPRPDDPSVTRWPRGGEVWADPNNGRFGSLSRLDENGQRGDLSRGWVYLLNGRWLVLWAGIGVLVGSRGPLRRRWGLLAAWGVLGALLATGLCYRRLVAEHHWSQAKLREAEGDWPEARRSLEAAVSWLPEFDRLERTWLLAGKLDFSEGRVTPRARFFQAYQLSRSPDEVSRRAALAVMEELLADGGGEHPAVVRQAARAWTAAGLDALAPSSSVPGLSALAAPSFATGARPDYINPECRLMGAQAAWFRADGLLPGKRDAAFYLGMVAASVDPDCPGSAERHFRPLLTGLGDRILRADVLNTLGDAYQGAGQANQARRHYAESAQAISLPLAPNRHALKGLGGL
jgi:hypothetical protein